MTEVNKNIGLKGKDKITGFEGTITGFCQYVTGCSQYLLAPPVDKEGKHVDGRWFDEHRITVDPDTQKIDLSKSVDKGSCEQAPIK